MEMMEYASSAEQFFLGPIEPPNAHLQFHLATYWACFKTVFLYIVFMDKVNTVIHVQNKVNTLMQV